MRQETHVNTVFYIRHRATHINYVLLSNVPVISLINWFSIAVILHTNLAAEQVILIFQTCNTQLKRICHDIYVKYHVMFTNT